MDWKWKNIFTATSILLPKNSFSGKDMQSSTFICLRHSLQFIKTLISQRQMVLSGKKKLITDCFLGGNWKEQLLIRGPQNHFFLIFFFLCCYCDWFPFWVLELKIKLLMFTNSLCIFWLGLLIIFEYVNRLPTLNELFVLFLNSYVK